METQRTTLFSSLIEDFDELRKDYECYCSDNDIKPQDLGEYDYHRWQVEDDFDLLGLTLDTWNKKFGEFLYKGALGLWCGNSRRMGVVSNLCDLVKDIMRTGDESKVELVDGHLEVYAFHHDGTNAFEVYALNEDASKILDDIEMDCRDVDSAEYYVSLSL